MTDPTTIEAAFLEAVDALQLADADGNPLATLDHEPEKLPKLPVLTMLLVQTPQEDVATGPMTEVRWAWKVTLYLRLSDFRKAQSDLKRLSPQLLTTTRRDPTLGETCERARFTDPGQEPTFATESGMLLKSFRLYATTSES